MVNEMKKVNGHMGTLIGDMNQMKNDFEHEAKRETIVDAAFIGETLSVAAVGAFAWWYRRKKRDGKETPYVPMMNDTDENDGTDGVIIRPSPSPNGHNLMEV